VTFIWQLSVLKRFISINAVSLVLILGTSHTSYAQEPIFIPISGFVENQSSHANESNDLSVVLNVFELGENIDTLTTNTSTDGSFYFDGVPGGIGFGYIITVEHDGVTYKYESDYPIKTDSVVIQIYNSSNTNFQNISIISHTLVITAADPSIEQIQTIGLVELENVGSLTFIPNMTEASKMEFLRFSLPEDVIDLDVQSSLRGGQILQVGLGFAITTPIPPGKHELAYTFTSPYMDGTFQFQQSLPIGADSFKILIPKSIGLVTADGLTTMKDITLGEKEYNGKEISNLPTGTKVDVLFYNLPEPSLLQKVQNGLKSGSLSKWLAPTVMATILALFFLSVVYQLRRNKKGLQTEWQSKGQEDLLDSVVYLEEQLARNEISYDHYIETRKQLLEQLSSYESFQQKGSL
tara:strand:+ start:1810 stop:3033 length:1224 start_codon:yes stop_codon:yes gene_type:complete